MFPIEKFMKELQLIVAILFPIYFILYMLWAFMNVSLSPEWWSEAPRAGLVCAWCFVTFIYMFIRAVLIVEGKS